MNGAPPQPADVAPPAVVGDASDEEAEVPGQNHVTVSWLIDTEMVQQAVEDLGENQSVRLVVVIKDLTEDVLLL